MSKKESEEQYPNNPFDLEHTTGQPLQLRKGSDAQARRSLIDKYNGKLNEESEDGTFVDYNLKQQQQQPKAQKAESSMLQLEDELNTAKNQKLKWILIVGGIIIAIIAIILIVVLHKHEKHPEPVPPTPDKQWDKIFNPYQIEEITQSAGVSYKMYNLTRDRSLQEKGNYSSYYANETLDNKFIESAILKTQVVGSFKGMRIQLYDQNSSNHQYKVSNEFLDPDFVRSTQSDVLRYQEMSTHFSVDVNSHSNRSVSESAFTIKANYVKEWRADTGPIYEEFLTTVNQSLYLMKFYQEISLDVRSQHVMGWGERNSEHLHLRHGNHTIFPQAGQHSFDHGRNGTGSGAGAHPFLMIQISGTNKYAGLFLLNSNSMSLELHHYNHSVNETADRKQNWSKLTFRTTGGQLDFFLFFGPTFQDVVRQYQEVIGRPKMLPLWAHGFFAKSPSYGNATVAIQAIQGFRAANYSLQGIVLPSSNINDYFNSSDLQNAIRAQFKNATDIQLIIPFNYFVPNVTDVAWIDKFNNNSDKRSFAVKAEGLKLPVEVYPDVFSQTANLKGWCMNVFDPKFESEFLEPVLLRKQSEKLQGYWLANNTPAFKTYDHSFEDPWILPYRPGGAMLGGINERTLPEQAQHWISSTQSEYHHNLHALYGSKLAMQFIDALPVKRIYQQTPLVISDSTYAGLGRTGAAHLFEQSTPFASYQDLQNIFHNLINFGMFGMSNVGLQAQQTDNGDSDLFEMYFQLGVVSPLFFYADNNLTLQSDVYNDSLQSNFSIKFQQQRNSYMRYMRSSLKQIEKFGGSLLRPLSSEFESQSNNSFNQSSLMYGHAILADFTLYQYPASKNITLPIESNWIYLNKFEPIQGGSNVTLRTFWVQEVPMFQKAGTIVPFQDPSMSSNISDLHNQWLDLSIALHNGYAFGYVYFEDGSESEYKTEVHEIIAEHNVISFKQQDIFGQDLDSKDAYFHEIKLSFLNEPVNTACALLKDLKTVVPLGVKPEDATKQAVLTRLSEDTMIRFNNISHIYYGYSSSNETCSQKLFGYNLTIFTPIDDYSFEARLVPGVSSFMGNRTADQHVYIELLSDNSIHFVMTHNYTRGMYETPAQIYDRNFTQVKKANRTLKIQDVIQDAIDPLTNNSCFNVAWPNSSEILFSTCGTLLLQQRLHSIFSFNMPAADPDRFHGLGERKGPFFLQDTTTYALFNNDNNVLSSHPAGNRVVEYGRNGFHPVIYSKLNSSANHSAFILHSAMGQEISFSKKPSPTFVIESASREIEFTFIFNLTAIETVESVFKHVKIGEQLHKTQQQAILPPPSWALGHHMTLPKEKVQIDQFIEKIKNVTGFPVEGVVIDEAQLQWGQSFTLNNEMFPYLEQGYLQKQNMSIFFVSKPTHPKSGDIYLEDEVEAVVHVKTTIKAIGGQNDFEGSDQNGRIVYVDYSDPQSNNTVGVFLKNAQDWYKFSVGKLGVSLVSNEISTTHCSLGSCDHGYPLAHPTPMLAYVKPGNLDMHLNTLPIVHRVLGSEQHLHNVNGLLQQIAYSNIQSPPPLLISASTALGSGQLGNVARQFDYYDVSDDDFRLATQQMQSSSVLGLPLVGVRFRSKFESDPEYAKRATLFGAYTPSISTLDYYQQAQLTLRDPAKLLAFRQSLGLKYAMMAYTRTQLYTQINFGTPFIRPLFYEFDGFATDEAVSSMYMYGPSILSSNDMVYSAKKYPSQCNFCAVHGGLSADTICFNTSINTTYDGKQQVFLKEGTITPLYSFNNSANATYVTKADDLLANYTLDMHIFNTIEHGNITSRGSLLMDGGVGGIRNEIYCDLRFHYANDTVNFSKLGKDQCKTMTGYQLKYVYLYMQRNETGKELYLSASINNQISLNLIEVDSNEYVETFQVDPAVGSINWYDLTSITFNHTAPTPPLPPTVIVQ